MVKGEGLSRVTEASLRLGGRVGGEVAPGREPGLGYRSPGGFRTK